MTTITTTTTTPATMIPAKMAESGKKKSLITTRKWSIALFLTMIYTHGYFKASSKWLISHL